MFACCVFSMLSFSTSLPSYRGRIFQTDSLPLCQSAYLSTTVCLLNSNDRCLSIIIILLLLFNITYRFKCHLFGLFCIFDPIIQWPPSFSCPSSLVTFFYRALIFDTVVHLPYALSSSSSTVLRAVAWLGRLETPATLAENSS